MKNNRKVIYILLLILFMTSSIAYSEVMDKELSLYNIWGIGLLLASLCFVIARFKPLLLLIIVPLLLISDWVLIDEVRDPFVGSAIQAEAGIIYIYSVYLDPLVLILSIILGLVLRKLNVHSKKLVKSQS